MEQLGRADRIGLTATWALAAYAATVPFQRLFQFGGIGSPATVAGLLVVALGGIALLQMDSAPRLHPSIVCAALLTAIIVLGLGYTDLPTASLHPRIRGLAAADAAKTIQLLIVLGLMSVLLQTRQRAAIVAGGYVTGAYVAVAGNVVEWAQSGFGDARISGSDAAQPNVVALGLAIGVPLAWFALNELQNRPARLLMAGYLVAGPVGVLLTGSRTGAATTAFAFLVVLLSFNLIPVASRAAVLVVLTAGLLFLPSLLSGGQIERGLSALTETEEQELDRRADLFAIAWEEVSENPLTGSGRGSVREENSLIDGQSKFSSHNSFLNIGSEYGIPALGLYLSMWIFAAVTALRARGVARITSLMVLAVAVGGSQVVNFDLEKANWFALGIALAMARPGNPPADEDPATYSQATEAELAPATPAG